jgi:hypothetical protein
MKGGCVTLDMQKPYYFIFLYILVVSACSSQTFESVEAFEIDTLEVNDQGTYDITGYKKVNSITVTSESRSAVKAEIKAIEDHYDHNGKYLKTVLLHSESSLNKSNDTVTGDEKEIILFEPLTLQVDYTLSEDDKKQIKELVLRHLEKIDEE